MILVFITNKNNVSASNVVALAELADRFNVPSLLEVCEKHLINCVEIRFIERLIFAHQHAGLNGLKVYFFMTQITIYARAYPDKNVVGGIFFMWLLADKCK